MRFTSPEKQFEVKQALEQKNFSGAILKPERTNVGISW